jgi:hypothetical protein
MGAPKGIERYAVATPGARRIGDDFPWLPAEIELVIN